MNWTAEDEKLIYAAVKKATRGFKFIPRGYEIEDLLQEGALAWWQAMDKHNPDHGAKSTFLFTVVRRQIIDLIRGGDTDKRKAGRDSIEYIDGVTPMEPSYGNRKISPELIEYDGDEELARKPTGWGASTRQRLLKEAEPEEPTD